MDSRVKEHSLRDSMGKLAGDFESALDIGAGIRPILRHDPRVLCVEPSPVYAEILEADGNRVWPVNAETAVIGKTFPDVIFMLDVIEHMDKETGARVLELTKEDAQKMVIVLTPKGFRKQEIDEWGLGQEEFQKHRSGWNLDDFPGWLAEEYMGQYLLAVYTR